MSMSHHDPGSFQRTLIMSCRPRTLNVIVFLVCHFRFIRLAIVIVDWRINVIPEQLHKWFHESLKPRDQLQISMSALLLSSIRDGTKGKAQPRVLCVAQKPHHDFNHVHFKSFQFPFYDLHPAPDRKYVQTIKWHQTKSFLQHRQQLHMWVRVANMLWCGVEIFFTNFIWNTQLWIFNQWVRIKPLQEQQH